MFQQTETEKIVIYLNFHKIIITSFRCVCSFCAGDKSDNVINIDILQRILSRDILLKIDLWSHRMMKMLELVFQKKISRENFVKKLVNIHIYFIQLICGKHFWFGFSRNQQIFII